METLFWTFQSASVTLKIRSRSPKSDLLFPFPQQCIYASLVKIHLLVQKTTHYIWTFQSAAVTLKIRSRSPNSNQLVPLSQQCIHASLVKIHQMVQKITYGKKAMRTQIQMGSALKTICWWDIIKIRSNILAVLLLVHTASMVTSRQQNSSQKSKTLIYHIILRGSKFWTVLNGPCCDDLRHVVHSNFLRHSLTKSHQAKIDVRLINTHLRSLKLEATTMI